MLELHDENYAAAIEIYGAAWKDARTEMESAEVLNALARCALKAGDLDLARDAHRKLSFYGLTLDADGAHPATMSYLRMAQHLGHERGAPVLSEWARGILDGRFPIYPGCRLALRDAMALAAQWREDGRDCRVLLSELAHVDGKIDFVSTYADILKSSSGERARYVSGTSETGESFLLYNSDLRQEKITGLLFDLGRLRETVADSEVGRRLQDRGFGFDLFDADHSPDFEAQYAETISVVTPASEWMERMQLGIYVADASSAIEYYRNRNLVILTGIFALAGFVALGGYMIFRDSTREMHLARLRSEFVSILDVPVRQLSLGQRMRCDLVAALLHAPSLLFLDEPTIGLDAVSKLAVRDFIKRLNRERGTTVILTTHDMDDIEALCDRILVIGEGRILSDGSLDQLRARVSTERRLLIDLEEENAEIDDPDATIVRRDGHRVHLSFSPERVSAAALIGRIAARHAVRDLFVENPPIEEIIARLYRNS